MNTGFWMAWGLGVVCGIPIGGLAVALGVWSRVRWERRRRPVA